MNKIFNAKERSVYAFRQANLFRETSERCLEKSSLSNDMRVLVISSPFIVNAAFACELYFKSLLLNKNIRYEKGHSLCKLYRLLNLDDNLKNLFTQKIIFLYKGKNFEEDLRKNSNAFIKWRYCFESSKQNNISPEFLLFLQNSLHKLAKDLIKE